MFDLPQMMKERTQLLRRIEAIDRLIEAARAYQMATAFPPNVSPAASPPKPNPTERAPSIMELTENAVHELLEKRGEAVPLGEIIRHLQTSGVPLPDRNTNNVVSARLSNSKRFVGRRGLGWWFADRPWPGQMQIIESRLATPNGIGAPNGEAASAPEAGEGSHPSPIENREGASLPG